MRNNWQFWNKKGPFEESDTSARILNGIRNVKMKEKNSRRENIKKGKKQRSFFAFYGTRFL